MLVSALKEAGFIDEDMKVHDWETYAKHLIYQRLYNSKRKDKKSTEDLQLDYSCKNNVLKATNLTITKPNQVSNSASGTNVPPTLEEVAKYCRDRNNSVEPQRFIDFYSAKGWAIGKNRMKNWMAAVRTWERSDSPKPQGGWSGKPAF